MQPRHHRWTVDTTEHGPGSVLQNPARGSCGGGVPRSNSQSVRQETVSSLHRRSIFSFSHFFEATNMKDVLVNYVTAPGSLTLSYWELQDDKNTSVVVSPATTHDEAFTTGTISITQLVESLAFVRSRYPTTGISSSCDCGLGRWPLLTESQDQGGR